MLYIDSHQEFLFNQASLLLGCLHCVHFCLLRRLLLGLLVFFTSFSKGILDLARNKNSALKLLLVALLIQILPSHHAQTGSHVIGQNLMIELEILVLEAWEFLANLFFREDFQGLLSWNLRDIVLHDL